MLDLYVSITGADPGLLEKGFICIKGWCFAALISFFLNSPCKCNNVVLRPNYLIFIGYLKTGGGGLGAGRVLEQIPLTPSGLDTVSLQDYYTYMFER